MAPLKTLFHIHGKCIHLSTGKCPPPSSCLSGNSLPGGPVAERSHSQCRRSKLDHHTLPLKFPYVAAETQHSQINNFFFLKNSPELCQHKAEAVVAVTQGQLCFSDLFPWVLSMPWHSFASKGPDRCLWNVHVYVHLHTYLCIQVYTYLHTCVYRYTYIDVYFCVHMHRYSHRARPCNLPGAWHQDTQIPDFMNTQVPYLKIPASPVSTSSVSLSAYHWLEIDTQSFKCVTWKENTKEKKITMPYTSVKLSTFIKNFCIYYCLASFLICEVDCLPACLVMSVSLWHHGP